MEVNLTWTDGRKWVADVVIFFYIAVQFFWWKGWSVNWSTALEEKSWCYYMVRHDLWLRFLWSPEDDPHVLIMIFSSSAIIVPISLPLYLLILPNHQTNQPTPIHPCVLPSYLTCFLAQLIRTVLCCSSQYSSGYLSDALLPF